MFLIPPELEEIYNAAGRHLGEIYDPLLANEQFTPAYAASTATRPACRLIWRGDVCPEPTCQLAVVWMTPRCPNPLAVSPAAFGYVVQALDAGCSAMIHAADETTIDGICAAVTPMLGGWRA